MGNSVIQQRISEALNVVSDRISDDVSPQISILDMVIAILMHFCAFLPLKSFSSLIGEFQTT